MGFDANGHEGMNVRTCRYLVMTNDIKTVRLHAVVCYTFTATALLPKKIIFIGYCRLPMGQWSCWLAADAAVYGIIVAVVF